VEAGRVLLDGRRTATDEPKSTASRRTVPVEEIQRGTGALLRSLKAARPLTGSSWAPDTRTLVWSWWISSGSPFGRSPQRPLPEAVPSGGAPAHLPPPRSAHAGRAMDRPGVAPVDAAPLMGHTVDVYVSTYLRPSAKGAEVRCQCSRSRSGRWVLKCC
jgi:hypothetical protein